jgi:hypothetical protein
MLAESLILFCVLFYLINLYCVKFTRLTQDTRFDLVAGTVSIIHAILISIYSIYVYYNYSIYGIPMDHTNLISLDYPSFETALTFTAGYVLYDLVVMWYYNKISKAFVFHHIVVFCATYGGIISSCGKYILFMTLLSEITNPFINLNTVLSILAKEKIYIVNSTFKLVNMIIFVLMYTIFRVCLLTWLLYKLIWLYSMEPSVDGQCSTEHPVVKFLYVLFFGHYALNMYWFGLILNKTHKMIFKKTKLE